MTLPVGPLAFNLVVAEEDVGGQNSVACPILASRLRRLLATALWTRSFGRIRPERAAEIFALCSLVGGPFFLPIWPRDIFSRVASGRGRPRCRSLSAAFRSGVYFAIGIPRRVFLNFTMVSGALFMPNRDPAAGDRLNPLSRLALSSASIHHCSLLIKSLTADTASTISQTKAASPYLFQAFCRISEWWRCRLSSLLCTNHRTQMRTDDPTYKRPDATCLTRYIPQQSGPYIADITIAFRPLILSPLTIQVKA